MNVDRSGKTPYRSWSQFELYYGALVVFGSRDKLRGRLRIISGQFKSREIRFDSSLDIRPTTDSVRETLFNWLQSNVPGARCLDLYAGSGALGFEALSRGAAHVVFVDSEQRCVRQLRQTAAELAVADCTILRKRAEKFLLENVQRFDIVFVDPPYRQGLALRTIELLASTNCVNPGALIYVEAESELDTEAIPPDWTLLRTIKAKSRIHCLYSVETENRP